MPKKPAKKSPKPMGRKQMKKTKGGSFPGFGGGVRVAVGDVNGDSLSLKQNPGAVQVDPNNPN